MGNYDLAIDIITLELRRAKALGPENEVNAERMRIVLESLKLARSREKKEE